MATRTRDPYEVLGVERDASDDDIRRAYRRLARENHPDVSKSDDAEERFKEISQAYDILRDPEKREAWERAQRGGFDVGGGGPAASGFRTDFGGSDFGDGDFGDIFESFFSRRGGGRGSGFDGFTMRGGDQEATLELTLEEAARGGRRRLTLGDGRDFEVDIPRGVRDGQRIRLAGEGGAGTGDGPTGDLFLRVRIRPHPRFRLEGRDLYVDLPVTPWEAALGASVEVPTLDGTARVKVPPGSSSGRRLRLRGQGFPAGRGDDPGDLYAVVKIMVPKKPSKKERELFEQLAKVSKFDPRKER
jgi:curved DNA-binding protein